MTLTEESQRGVFAKQVIENPIWQEAWEKYETNIRAWIEDPNTPDDVVLQARQRLLLLRQVKRDVQKVMETGLLAETEMERIRNARNDG